MSEHSAEKDALREAAEAEVRDRFAGLLYERSRLQTAGLQPTGVVMPARLNVPYDGPGRTTARARCMGLPVTWSEHEEWGLVVHLPTVTPPGGGR